MDVDIRYEVRAKESEMAEVKCDHGEWYVGGGNMVCGRGCEQRASDIIADLSQQLVAKTEEHAGIVAKYRNARIKWASVLDETKAQKNRAVIQASNAEDIIRQLRERVTALEKST